MARRYNGLLDDFNCELKPATCNLQPFTDGPLPKLRHLQKFLFSR